MDFLQEWAENFLNGELALRESAQFIEAAPDEQEGMLYDYQVGCDLTFEEKCKEICAQKRIQEEEKQRQNEYVTALICCKKLIRKESIEDDNKGYLATKISKLIGFFNLIFGNINEEEKAILEEKIIECYKQKNITFDDKKVDLIDKEDQLPFYAQIKRCIKYPNYIEIRKSCPLTDKEFVLF